MARDMSALLSALLLLTSGWIAGAAVAGHNTTTVCDTGCDHTSIQDAIDATAAGETIEIGPGTYTEALSIPATKAGQTLSAAGEDQVTVDASASSSYGLEIAADDVTVEGLTLVGPADGFYGIHAADTPEDLTGLTIQEMTIRESASTELDLHAVQGATVSNVTLLGQGTGGNGLAVTDSHDVTVSNLTTSGNTWGGFAIYTSGSFVDIGTSGITLTGDNSIDEVNPVYLQGPEGTISDLDLQGYPIEIEYGSSPDFQFRQPDVDTARDAITTLSQDSRLDLATATIFQPSADTWHTVDGMQIGVALDGANADDTVLAHGGTYDEQVALDVGGLTLAGDDEATLTDGITVAADGITLANLRIEDPSHHGVESGGSIEDLTMDGLYISQASSAFRVANAHGLDGLTITDSTFEENKFGIYFAHHPYDGPGTDLAPVTNVLIEDTQFLDSERKGLYMETLDDAVLRNVVVSGVTSPSYGFNNGIDINLKADDYSDITIEDTVVEDVSKGDPFRGTDSFSSAIAIKARDDGGTYGSAPATLTGVTLDRVTVRDSFNGLRFGEPGVDYSEHEGPTDVTVRDSSFSGNTGYHLQALPGNLDIEAVLAENDFETSANVERAGGDRARTVWSTIGAAVDDADAAETVHVGDGIYDEHVTVDDPLTLVGPQAGEDARDRTGDEAVVSGIDLDAGDVTVDGFTFRSETCTGAGTGVETSGDHAGYTIVNNVIEGFSRGAEVRTSGQAETDIGYNAFVDNDCGQAAGLLSGFGPVGTMEDVRIHDNSFQGHTEGSASYAIQLVNSGTHSDVTIRNNTMQSSMVLCDARDLVIDGNEIQMDDPDSSTAIFVCGGVEDANITNNRLDGTERGLWFAPPIFSGETNSGFHVLDNVIVDNPTAGVQIAEDRYEGELVVQFNEIAGNGIGVDNQDAGLTVDASHNWWGSELGPTVANATDGLTGDRIEGSVDFAPFCLEPSCLINSNVHDSPAPHVAAGGQVSATLG